MKRRFILLSLLFSVVCSAFIIIDKNPIQGIVSSLQSYFQRNYQEKVYVQTDTDTYFSGDLIWFNTRILEAQNHTPSQLSKVVHVKLFDSKNNELYYNKVFCKNGIGKSEFVLADTLTSGVYKLQAYTEWMKNFSQDFFFNKEVYVVNEKPGINDQIKEKEELVDVGFYPEGGSLLLETNNKIGFKAINNRGEAVGISGNIVDDDDIIIHNVSTYKYGIGNFELRPEKNKTYYLQLEFNGNSKKIRLPEATSEGLNLRVNPFEGSTISVEIEMTNGYLKEINKIYLVSHCRGVVNYAAEGRATKNSIIDIPRNRMRPGVNHITIFNQSGQPLAERLVFIKPNSSSKLSLTGNNGNYTTRSKVELDLVSLFEDDINLTVSVHDRPLKGSINIQNYLLLTSDLKGTIEHPEFYFSDNDSARVAADNLMLTHGWVRFNWDELNNIKDRTFNYPAERIGPIFRGKLVDQISNNPVKDTLIILSTIDPNPNFLFNRLSDNSEFIFNLHELYGQHKLFVNVFGQDSLNQYKLLPSDSYDTFKNKLPMTSNLKRFNPELNIYEVKKKDEMILNNYRVYEPNASKYWKERKEKSEFRIGQSLEVPDYSVNPEDFVALNNFEEVLKELAPATTFRNVKGSRKIFVYEYVPLASAQRDIPLFNKEPATVFINGIPIFNEQIAYEGLVYENIDQVDIYIGQYKFADHDFYGFISAQTKDINTVNNILSYTTNSADYQGLSVTKEYYTPKYDQENPYQNRIPDLRHLIHWIPNVTIKSMESKKLMFYTSDVQNDYHINIEGISKSGEPIFLEQKISVNNIQ